jgi:uncharacterized protein (DUF362 family)
MTKISRREFLRLAALTMGGVTLNHLLAGCSPQKSTPELTTDHPLPTAAGAAPESAATTQAANSTANVPAGVPDLVVARNGDPESMVRRAIAALGGMERFVHPGARVIVKPNICVDSHSYEYAATTNPWVVGALVKMALEARARSVRVMDYPFGGTAESAYANSGIQEQVQAAGGEMVTMTGFKYISTEIPAGSALKKTDVYDEILTADVLIDAPVAKHHSMARLTLGMKNLMGVIRNRSALHRNLGQSIADLNSLIRPQLTVIDAVRILMANGPTGGNLNDVKQLDTIVASPDVVAADSYAASFFGLQPADLAYIQAGSAMGLGRSDLSNLKIEELSL